MTKLKHEKLPHWGPDPGAIVSVPDVTRPYVHVTDAEKAQRSKEIAEERRKLAKLFAGLNSKRL